MQREEDKRDGPAVLCLSKSVQSPAQINAAQILQQDLMIAITSLSSRSGTGDARETQGKPSPAGSSPDAGDRTRNDQQQKANGHAGQIETTHWRLVSWFVAVMTAIVRNG